MRTDKIAIQVAKTLQELINNNLFKKVDEENVVEFIQSIPYALIDNVVFTDDYDLHIQKGTPLLIPGVSVSDIFYELATDKSYIKFDINQYNLSVVITIPWGGNPNMRIYKK